MDFHFPFRQVLKLALVVISTFWLVLHVRADPPSFQIQGVAEKLILDQVTYRQVIDLSTNSPAETNRMIRGAFLEWLLTKGQQEIHHGGLRLRNAIIVDWV